MRTIARATLVPTFDVESFAKEAIKLTVIPPSTENPTWAWLNETGIPTLCVQVHEIPVGELDHRTAFLLLHVDGASSLREIVRNSGIAREETLGIFATLMERGYLWLQDADLPNQGAPCSGIRDLSARKHGADELDEIAANW